jgi:hypothetical protein
MKEQPDGHTTMLSFLTDNSLPDPFTERKPKRQRSDFERRLEQSSVGRRNQGIQLLNDKSTAKNTALFEDPEITLVGGNDEALEDGPSSPESNLDGSSNDSTSSRKRHKSTNTTSRDIDEEWMKALEPHQRSLLDILYQISDDLIRYLVSHEQAIKDLHAGYLKNGISLIEELDRKYQHDKLRIRHELRSRKNIVRKRLDDFQRRIAQDIAEVGAESLLDLENDMRRNQDLLAKKIRGSRT